MLEVMMLRMVLVGSIGVEALILSGWMRWWQAISSQLDEEEEETLTRYESKDDPVAAEPHPNGSVPLGSKDPRLVGWEFKIVRANSTLFRNPAVFQHLCEEEAQAGWIMLEKLDDRRVRFKRPLAMRELIQPETLPFDAYRCHYGPGMTRRTGLLAIAAAIAIFLPAVIGYSLVTAMLVNDRNTTPAPTLKQQVTPERAPKLPSGEY